MAAVTSNLHHVPPINSVESNENEPYSPNIRDTSTPEYNDDQREEKDRRHESSFSIHNVLKKERDDNSSESVFSTDKLLQNTPNFDNDYSSPRESRNSLELSPRFETDDQSSNLGSVRAEISIDEDSCCSEDTVLSVGNEAPLSNFNSSESTSKSAPNSPEMPQVSFKHIQTHLHAISQLSQNVNINPPLLLRPNPITPNLMFLNQQQMLFQNHLLNPEVKVVPNRVLASGIPQPFANINLNFNPRKAHEDLRTRIEDRRTMKEDEIINQNLKFSIDNILKADFGRRITDPLTKRKSLKKFDVAAQKAVSLNVKDLPQISKEDRVDRVPDAKAGEKGGAIDLSKGDESSSTGNSSTSGDPLVWPAWVYCTRYSDRPSSGRSPRTRRPKKPPGEVAQTSEEKRPRTAFSGPQLARLKHEFTENRYLTERRRQALAAELGLAEAQIKIWFQNKRAKIKKASGQRNPLALQLMAQGLYNHSTVPLTREEEELEMKAREREQQNRQ